MTRNGHSVTRNGHSVSRNAHSVSRNGNLKQLNYVMYTKHQVFLVVLIKKMSCRRIPTTSKQETEILKPI